MSAAARVRKKRKAGVLANSLSTKTDPWTDLALTIPILVVYHLGVVFLPVRNAADVLTDKLASLASYNLIAYSALAASMAIVLVIACATLAKGRPFRRERFLGVLLEGAIYAVLMRFMAATVVGKLLLATSGTSLSPFAGLVMSFGAGFYEEAAFRVVLFGLGLRLLKRSKLEPSWLVPIAWAIFTAAIFSGWHYLGPEPFAMESFVFRWTCGVVLTAIYAYRGFATAVWTHALYDVWVLVF